MASTYSADRAQTGVEPIFNAIGDITPVSVYALSAAFVINDVVNMMTLPNGVYVTDVVIATSVALDTGSAITYDVGDSNSATRYISGKTQSSNVPLAPYHMDQPGGLGYKIGTNTGDNVIAVKIHTAPTTGATSGNLILTVTYSRQSKTETS